jgi:hypothetical protein
LAHSASEQVPSRFLPDVPFDWKIASEPSPFASTSPMCWVRPAASFQ